MAPKSRQKIIIETSLQLIIIIIIIQFYTISCTSIEKPATTTNFEGKTTDMNVIVAVDTIKDNDEPASILTSATNTDGVNDNEDSFPTMPYNQLLNNLTKQQFFIKSVNIMNEQPGNLDFDDVYNVFSIQIATDSENPFKTWSTSDIQQQLLKQDNRSVSISVFNSNSNETYLCATTRLEANDVKCATGVVGNKLIISPSDVYFTLTLYGMRSFYDIKVKVMYQRNTTYKLSLVGYNEIFFERNISNNSVYYITGQLNNMFRIRMMPNCEEGIKIWITFTYKLFNVNLVEDKSYPYRCWSLTYGAHAYLLSITTEKVPKDLNTNNMNLDSLNRNNISYSTKETGNISIGLFSTIHANLMRIGYRDIFLLPVFYCETYSNIHVENPGRTNYNLVNMSITSSSCGSDYQMVHGEVLTKQRYWLNYFSHREKNTIVTTMTGDNGTDDGITLTLYYINYKTQFTLDTKNDDFKSNTLDVFLLQHLEDQVNCIAVESVTPTTQWIMKNISINDGTQDLITFRHNAPLNKYAMYCKDPAVGDFEWTVIIYDANKPSANATSIRIMGSNPNGQYYFLSYKNYNSSGPAETFIISIPDIGKFVGVRLIKYDTFYNIDITLKREMEEYNFHYRCCNARSVTMIEGRCDVQTNVTQLFELCSMNDTCYINQFTELMYKEAVWLLQIEGLQTATVDLVYKDKNVNFLLNTTETKSQIMLCPSYAMLPEISYIRIDNCDVDGISIELTLLLPSVSFMYAVTDRGQNCSCCVWVVKRNQTEIISTLITEEITSTLQTEEITSTLQTEEITSTPLTEERTSNLQTEEITSVETKTTHQMTNSETSVTEESVNKMSTSEASVTEASVTSPEILVSTNERMTERPTTKELSEPDTEPDTPALLTTGDSIATSNPESIIFTLTVTPFTDPVPYPPANTTLCPCECGNERYNLTQQELDKRLLEIISELRLRRNATSKYIRSKVSMPDARLSSKCIGTLAVIVIVVPFALIISVDVLYLLKWFYGKFMS